jgi:hypothetical protein
LKTLSPYAFGEKTEGFFLRTGLQKSSIFVAKRFAFGEECKRRSSKSEYIFLQSKKMSSLFQVFQKNAVFLRSSKSEALLLQKTYGFLKETLRFVKNLWFFPTERRFAF